MPVTTNALNHMINNARALTSLEDGNVMALTFTTPTADFNSGSIPTNILTDLVPCNFGSASGGVRALSSDVVLTANQVEQAFYLAIYTRTENIPPRQYVLLAYTDITPIELTTVPATLVSVKASVTSIGLANA